jgi:hypothetical protein
MVPGKISPAVLIHPPIVTGPFTDITYALVLLIAVFVAVWVAPLDTVVSRAVKDVGVRVNLRIYSVLRATETPGTSHVLLIQLKWIPFEFEIHTPQPRPVLTVLYISPISARQVLPVAPVLNLIFISQVGIAPRIGKLVRDNVRLAGDVMEYSVSDDAGTITAATPELSDVYENAPELSDVGAVREKDASAKRYDPIFGPRVNVVPKVGSIAFTVSVVLTVALR